MKKIIIVFACTIGIVSVKAQSAKYTEFMKKNVAMLDSVKTADDLQNSANNFDRIANAEKTQWLPYYYEAYSLVMKSFMTKDPKAIDANCDKADEALTMAESLSKDNSEITTLKSMVLTARMQADQSRGMTMGPKSTMLLQQAMQQQPANNPRTLMQLSQMKFYTPAAFGGSKEKAIELLKKSIAAYDTFKPATDIDPNWGKDYAVSLLAQWSK